MANTEENNQNDSPKLKCNICYQDYASISSLRAHMDNLHQNHRHKCDKCEKSFGRPTRLTEHIKLVHDKVKHVKPFECELCGESFRKST